jgi:uncharacterized SAM-dependent methyltransferase
MSDLVVTGGQLVPAPTQRDGFHRCLLEGLARSPKALPCKYFYDATGSDLFDRICALPEYYQTRTEFALLGRHAPEMAFLAGSDVQLIEFGAGSLRKVRVLLDALDGVEEYVPIDISGDYLRAVAAQFESEYPALAVTPVVGDFTTALQPSGNRRAAHRVFSRLDCRQFPATTRRVPSWPMRRTNCAAAHCSSAPTW